MSTDIEARLRAALAMVEQYLAERKECDRLKGELAALKAQLAEAREALELILPLAKGYGDLHRVGSNAAYVECAAEVLRKMEKANG